jgi:beta-lactamase regulating signal transducer with metallopeptidase domain
MNILLGWLWQGTALALLMALALHVVPRIGASARHAVWWLTLLAVLALPLAHLVPAPPPAGAAHTAAGPVSAQPLLLPSPPAWFLAALIGTWLGTVVLGLARVLRGLDLLRRLRALTCPLDAEREDRLGLWRLARVRGRPCELRTSAYVHGACALGLWRPVVIVSRDLLEALDDEELDQVVLHEHAHLARYDDWTRLAQAIVEAVAGWHPAVALIGRQIDIEREAACDDRVVAQTGAARRYAACLATVGAASLGQGVSREPALLPGMARSGGTLLQRVARLLDPRRGHGLRLDPTTLVVTLAALALAVASSRHAGPMVEFVETSDVMALASPSGPDPVLPTHAGGVPAIAAPTSAPAVRRLARHDGPRAEAPAARRADQSGPAPPMQQLNASPPPAALQAVAWPAALEPTGPPPVAATTRPSLTAGASDRSPWASLASAGGSIGTGGKKAGLASARFFTRAAKAAVSS